VFMAPFAILPEAVAIPIFMAISLAAVGFAVRRLRLPSYWVLFPPLVDALIVGNPNAMLVALLMTRLAPVGVFAKIYGIIPVLAAGRWRLVAVTGVLLVATAPLLPWSTYIGHWDDLRQLQIAASENLSAWDTPLLVPTIVALFIIGPRSAGWLLVPAVWPNTQTHYNVMGLPVARGPLLALGLSIPIPLVAPLSVIVFAAARLVARVGRKRRLPTLRTLWAADP
jgi:hypothetical protein